MRIASCLIKQGLISLEQAQFIIREQEKSAAHERFGAIAVKRGFITEDLLEEALQEQIV
jgi:hypothetical protein